MVQLAARVRRPHNGPVSHAEQSAHPGLAGLTVAAVARRLGVATATLRTWDRRYGVGPGEHRPGSHRRYSMADLTRLEHMRRLVIEGVPPADAARAARELDLSQAPQATAELAEPVGRAGGGRVLAQPGADPVQRGLARAAQALDVTACETIIGRALMGRGVVWTWDRLLVPVLTAMGDRWRDSGRGIEIEHALSQAVVGSLTNAIRTMAAPVNSRAVLLACAPDEAHTLPLVALQAALAERRVGARTLGVGLPAPALAEAVTRLGPAAIFVWAQVPESAVTSMLDALPTIRPRATVVIGGPGWIGPVPKEVARVTDLSDAVARILHAVGE